MTLAPSEAAPGALRLAFFGDSICFGQWVSPHLTWVNRASEDLAAAVRRRGGDLLTANFSGNGQQTRQALERIGPEVQDFWPDVLLVQFGLNDCNYWTTDRGVPRVSERAFAANLEEIIVRGMNFGARAVVVNTNHPTGRTAEPMPFAALTYQESNARYNELIRQVVADLGPPVVLNDIAAEWHRRLNAGEARLADLVMPDLLHLTRAGHDLYFDLVVPRLKPMLLSLDALGARPS